MSKQTVKRPFLGRLRTLSVLLMAFVLVAGINLINLAHADQYDNQINALQNQNNAAQNQVDGLQNQASSYQDEIAQLQNQISALESAITINQNEQASLVQQISDDQQKITLNKQFLSDDIRTMYIDGQMSTIEELATSKNLSDYVDKETYRQTVQNKVDALITQIGQLEAQQQQQKAQLDVVINTEKQQDSQLAASQAEQQQLLAYNQQQQDSYNQQIQSNQAQIAVLRQEQIAANRRLASSGGGVITSGSCGGSYPAQATNGYGGSWGCNYSLDSSLDNWGMYNRECVSYTAWMVYKTYGYMPYWGGSGDANQWPADARAAGIATGSTPKVGSVAIYMGGAGDPWGHAMWVDSVNGDGTITVSQYNLYYDGNYYQTNISAAGLVYIYFGG